MAARITVLLILLGFAGLVVFSVRPSQRAAVLAALPLTLGAVAGVCTAIFR